MMARAVPRSFFQPQPWERNRKPRNPPPKLPGPAPIRGVARAEQLGYADGLTLRNRFANLDRHLRIERPDLWLAWWRGYLRAQVKHPRPLRLGEYQAWRSQPLAIHTGDGARVWSFERGWEARA